jgi:hypothetical protein
VSTPTPPVPPKKPDSPFSGKITKMRVLGGSTEMSGGNLHIIHTMEIDGREDERFTVVVVGSPDSKLVQFVNALRCVELLLTDAGGGVVPGVTFDVSGDSGVPGSRRLQ